MDGGEESFRVVFLIDVRGFGGSDLDAKRKTQTVIRQSVLKLLTYFSCKVRRDTKNLQWGYKLYNSTQRKGAKQNFRDFDLKNFEEFEADLVNRFTDRGLKAKSGLIPGDRTSAFVDSSVNSEDDFDPCDALSKVLTEIVYDFQWDRPDLRSPVKIVRLKAPKKPSLSKFNGAKLEDSSEHKFVFVYSVCPHTLRDVLNFGDCQQNSRSLLGSFLSNHMYKTFHDSLNIRLFWIDIDGISNTDATPNDLTGLRLMSEALSLLRGGVIPISALLCSPLDGTASIQSLLSSEAGQATCSGQLAPVKLVPTSVMLDHYLWPRLTPWIHTGRVALITYSGSERQILCELTLCPLVSPSATDQTLDSTHSLTRVTSEATLASTNSTDLGIRFNAAPDVATVKTNQRRATAQPANGVMLVVRATVPRGDIPIQCYQSDRVYLVTDPQQRDPQQRDPQQRDHQQRDPQQRDPQQRDPQRREEDHVKWNDLLTELVTRQLVMVVDYASSHTCMPSTAILQPVTLTTATLTFLRSEVTTVFEKLLYFGPVDLAASERVSEGAAEERLRSFKEESVRRLMGRLPDVKDIRTDVKDCPATSQKRHLFTSSYLEKWVTPGVVTTATRDLLGYLHEGESTKAAECAASERCLSQHLHQHYIQQRTKRLNRHDNYVIVATTDEKRRSPRRSPRRSSPRKRTSTPIKRLVTMGSKGTTPPKNGCIPLRRSPRKHLSHGTLSQMPAAKRPKLSDRRERASSRITRSRTHTAPTRTALILQRSKIALAKHLGDDSTCSSSVEVGDQRSTSEDARKSIETLQSNDSAFSTEADFVQWLLEVYEKVTGDDTAPLTAAQLVVTTGLAYFRHTGQTVPQTSLCSVIAAHLLVSSGGIREKYKGQEGEDVRNAKVVEYQLQTALLLELHCLRASEDHSVDSSQHQTVHELVTMLRAMSFLRDPGFLGSYLSDVILLTYGDRCGQLLASIYDELLQPLPPQLHGFLSPSDDDPNTSSVSSGRPMTSVQSEAAPSVDDLLHSQNSSRVLRSCALTRHASFQMSGVRQIAVPRNVKPRPAVVGGRTRSSTVTHKEEEAPSEAKRVCRNLFRMQHNRAAASATRASSMFDTVPKATITHAPTPVTPRSRGVSVRESPRLTKTDMSPSIGETKTPAKTPTRGWRCKTPDHGAHLKLTLKSVAAKHDNRAKTGLEKNVSPKTPRRKQSVSTATLHLSMPGREQIQHARSASVEITVRKTPRKITPPRIANKTPRKRASLISLPRMGRSPDAGNSSLFMTPEKTCTATPPTNSTPRRSRRISEVLLSPLKPSACPSATSDTCMIQSPLKLPKSIVAPFSGAPCLASLDPGQSASCEAWALNTPTKDDQSVKCQLRCTPRRRTMSFVGAESVGNLPVTPHKRRHSKTVTSTPKVHHKLKTRVVMETPRHKQTAHRVWRKQEQRRRRSHTDPSHTDPDILTVEESPNKCVRPGAFASVPPPRKSPRRATVMASVTHLLRRSSFYSASSSLQSRTAQRCQLLEQRMTKAPLRSPVIARNPVDSVANDSTSPRRVKLFSQIL